VLFRPIHRQIPPPVPNSGDVAGLPIQVLLWASDGTRPVTVQLLAALASMGQIGHRRLATDTRP
jgi:hypothetical protein